MPTMTIDSTALPIVRSAGSRPAWNQIAAVMSMPLPLDSRVSSHWPAAVTSPAREKQSNVAQRTGLPRRLEERRGLARAPGERLDRLEQQRQKRCAETGAEPREGDRDPEAEERRDREASSAPLRRASRPERTSAAADFDPIFQRLASADQGSGWIACAPMRNA